MNAQCHVNLFLQFMHNIRHYHTIHDANALKDMILLKISAIQYTYVLFSALAKKWIYKK